MTQVQRSKIWPRMFVILAVIVALAVFPVAAALGAYAVADAAGCRLSEAEAHSCIILGMDVGEPLTFFGLLGWLGIASLPMGAIGVLIWLMFAVAIVLRSRGNRSTA